MLAALWATGQALTPAEIQARLDGDLACNTVHTILKRLTRVWSCATWTGAEGHTILPRTRRR